MHAFGRSLTNRSACFKGARRVAEFCVTPALGTTSLDETETQPQKLCALPVRACQPPLPLATIRQERVRVSNRSACFKGEFCVTTCATDGTPPYRVPLLEHACGIQKLSHHTASWLPLATIRQTKLAGTRAPPSSQRERRFQERVLRHSFEFSSSELSGRRALTSESVDASTAYLSRA